MCDITKLIHSLGITKGTIYDVKKVWHDVGWRPKEKLFYSTMQEKDSPTEKRILEY